MVRLFQSFKLYKTTIYAILNYDAFCMNFDVACMYIYIQLRIHVNVYIYIYT